MNKSLIPPQLFRGNPANSAGVAPMILEVMALCGYGLWMLLGLALALGIYGPGRGAALVPLALGCVFVSAGLVAAGARMRIMPEWHGWRIGQSQRPTPEALLALATYLPMLALAGLVRGNEGYWVTRIVSVVLVLCSLFCLITSAYGYRTRRLADQAGMAGQLPISRVLSAWYGGGLWLWVCIMFQTHLPESEAVPRPWIIGLLLMAMLLGLVDGVAWHSLRGAGLGDSWRHAHGLQAWRFLAAGLICAVPSLSLPMVTVIPWGRWLALCAAIACILGKSMELWLYDLALTHFVPMTSGNLGSPPRKAAIRSL